MRNILSLTLIGLFLSIASFAIHGISGIKHVCVGSTTYLYDTTVGGTWTSRNTGVATIGSITGVVTGISPGLDTISYSDSGATVYAVVTVDPLPAPIIGSHHLCAGQTLTLADSTPGGTWSGGGSVASVGSTTGVVTGLAGGTTIITFTSTAGCRTTFTLTVNLSPSPISGPGTVLTGGNIALTDVTPGGTWSSSNTGVATINSTTGLVTGVAVGTCVITYALPTGCYVLDTITDSAGASIAAISGGSVVCIGSTLGLTDSTTGGIWISSNTAIATVGSTTGVVTGVSSGTVTVTYAVGLSYVTKTITVSAAATITGPNVVCVGSTITLTGSPSGGAWSSGSSLIASVTGGVVTGVAVGTTNIYYSVGGCFAYHTVTVDATPTAIAGVTTVGVGGTTTLTDAVSGGTWSSSNTAIATVGSVTGVVTGVSSGSCTITYSIGGACAVYVTVTVTGGTTVDSIVGPGTVCSGSSITLTDGTPGGTWSSSNPTIAYVGSSTGVVTGMTAGTTVITYTVGTVHVTRTIIVNPLPAIIGGLSSVSVGSSITLTDATAGGIWSSSSTAIATVGSATGIVTGVSAGAVHITYTLPTGCYQNYVVIVLGGSGITPITGATSVCVGSYILLSDSTSGGTWSSSNTAIATVGSSTGAVVGVAGGTVTITYTVGTSYVTKTITVNPAPTAIGGSSTVSVGGTITLTDATAGGMWSSSNTGIATVGSATGIVTGVSAGTVTITYMLPTGCYVTKTITVTGTTVIDPITGGTSVCVGSTLALHDSTPGGTWSSSNPAVATVTSTGGIVTGIVAGTVTITYTVGTHFVTTTITVTSGATISGGSTVCTGSTITLTGTPTGGTWYSGGLAIATVGSSSGVVTAISSGIVNIYYTAGGCYAYHTVTVNAAATISGGSTLCIGSTTALTASLSGGTWSSGNTAVATVGSTGVVTGVGAGVVNIYYLHGTCYSSHTVTVNAAASISGSGAVCIGSTRTLTASPGGGVWSSSNTAIATVGSLTGVVTGVASGTATITYNAGGCYATTVVTVNASASISGGTVLCTGSTTTLTASPSGGTWSSSNPAIATVGSTGIVTGVSGGSVVIYYNAGGCSAYHTMTIDASATVSGSSSVCVGSNTTLTASITGGTWSSSNTAIATVSTAGIVHGVAPGVVTIYYLTGVCYTPYVVTVNATATITGSSTLCIGSTTTLTGSPSGGTWSSGNTAIATVGSTGIVTGVGAGIVNIYYASAGCSSAYHTVSVNATPVISGGSSVCVSGYIVLTATPGGGTWSSGNTAVATVGSTGVVVGVGSGVVNIYYTSGGCTAYHTVSVNTTSATITGSRFVCAGSTTVLSGTPSGGIWTSASGMIATVGSATGIVTGVAAGVTTIYYAVGGCSAYVSETVNPLPAPILGSSVVCVGSSTTLTDATSGGTWSSSNTAIATVGSSTGIVTGVSTGVATISFSEGGCVLTKTMSVNLAPPGITGPTSVLVGYAITLADAVSGGTWLSGNTSIATINPVTGVVIGVASGTVNMYYTVGGCTVYYTITVTDVPLTPVHHTSSVGTVNVSDGSLKVYPNPTSGKVSIQWENEATGTADISITDVTGREVYRSVMEINDATGAAYFDLGSLKNGVYLISIKSENIYYTGKLVVNK